VAEDRFGALPLSYDPVFSGIGEIRTRDLPLERR
jgi:hypothetical protein